MSEIAFLSERRAEIMGLLSDGGVEIVPVEGEPVKRGNSTWQSFSLVRGDAAALLVVQTRWGLPDHVTFILSRDMRRLLRPSTWRIDSRLVAELDRRLLSANGWYLGDGKG